MRCLIITLLVLLPPASTFGASPGDYLAEIGRRHGDFTLPEIRTGKPISLSDFRGKKVLLIHFASW
jgi:hypothetical protein